MSPRRSLLLLLALTLLAYARLWWADFSWDDEALVVDNRLTGSLANLPEILRADLWSTTRLPSLRSGYYRPLMLLSLALDRAIFGLSSAEAHVHSLLWHLAAVAMLWALLRRLVEPDSALLGAAVFALHPVQSEVLALVAARNDSMAAALSLGALVLLLDRDAGPARLGGAALALLAALLAKESALLAPAVLLALDLARWRRPGPWRRHAAMGAALLAYGAMRAAADLGEGVRWSAAGARTVLGKAPQIAALYARLLAWPWPLSPARHVHWLPPLSENLPGLLAVTGAALWALRRGRRPALVAAGLVWALAAWLPTLAATLDKGLLGERYLYLPMAGLALAVAAAVPRVPRGLVAGLALAGAAVLQLRLPDWQDSRTVWTRAHEVAPTPFTAGGLGWYLHRDGTDPDNPRRNENLARSLELFVEALEGDPPYRDVCDMIAMAFLEARQPARAAEVARWALEERGCPRDGLLVEHYAIALAALGRLDDAERAALSRPGGPRGPGWTAVAAARVARGDLAGARAVAARQDPDFPRRVTKLLRLAGRPRESALALSALSAGQR